jgi:hypothetical protein
VLVFIDSSSKATCSQSDSAAARGFYDFLLLKRYGKSDAKSISDQTRAAIAPRSSRHMIAQLDPRKEK